MIIISHRGFWSKPQEKNSIIAFKNALSSGFSIETDIRDFNGEVIISHDVPTNLNITLASLLKLVYLKSNEFYLALNVKSDGLVPYLSKIINEFPYLNYFLFDMSIPESRKYIDSGFEIFMRQSEFEQEVIFYEYCTGIWMDCFIKDWISVNVIQNHLKNNKKVCVVSPEIHNREYLNFWNQIKASDLPSDPNFMICTDYPEKARSFFNHEN